ncbi:MAG: thioredoxin-disulfide reductase [Tissierellia bacterium]|nr:thioredoxin-disulfide reductase [Tissierellia bacterium]
MGEIYDLIIIGAGPAGLSAGIYAGRSKLKTLIIEKETDGGQIALTSEVENYPGSIDGETGPSLVERMSKQAKEFGVKKVYDEILEVNLTNKEKILTGKKDKYKGKTVIIAAGAASRQIGCPGEEEFTGKGVSYCATCDAVFFENLEVFVVGGGDAALEEALYLAKFAKKVSIIHRRDELRAAKFIQEKAIENEKIHFIWDSVVKEIKGNKLVNSIVIENVKTKELKEIAANEEDMMLGIFIFIGNEPKTEMFEGLLNLENGYIVTDENMKTNIDGVFAAGDIRLKSLRQVVTAAADGAIAAVQAEKYLDNN